MSDNAYKLIHVQPFRGWEIIGEFPDKETAEARQVELLAIAPDAWLFVACAAHPAPPAEQEAQR